jgi:pantothenate kinase type III
MEAVTRGVYWSVAGGLEKLAGMTARAAGSRPDIFLTGGGAAQFRDAVGFPHIYEPDLLFRGLELIFYSSKQPE